MVTPRDTTRRRQGNHLMRRPSGRHFRVGPANSNRLFANPKVAVPPNTLIRTPLLRHYSSSRHHEGHLVLIDRKMMAIRHVSISKRATAPPLIVALRRTQPITTLTRDRVIISSSITKLATGDRDNTAVTRTRGAVIAPHNNAINLLLPPKAKNPPNSKLPIMQENVH